VPWPSSLSTSSSPGLRRAHLSLLARPGAGWLVTWLPILAGGIAYASLHLLPGGAATARDRAGRRLAAPGTPPGSRPRTDRSTR